MNTVAIRAPIDSDIVSILQIQGCSREAAQWPEDAYRALGRSGANAWVAGQGGNIAGFLVARITSDEMEILNVAVDPNLRRQGIGAALLRHAILWAAQRGALRAFLEVRSSNIAAIKFYEAHGFSFGGARRNYYREPDEDALIFKRVLEDIV